MPKVFTSPSQKLGKAAEDAVAQYLELKGFTVMEQNYTRKWGEIDILARGPLIDSQGNVSRETSDVTHFVEVKSVSRVTFEGGIVPKAGEFRPEDNMSFSKVNKLKTTIMSYIMSDRNDDKRHVSQDKRHIENMVRWQFDLIVVYVKKDTREMIIKPFWNLIL